MCIVKETEHILCVLGVILSYTKKKILKKNLWGKKKISSSYCTSRDFQLDLSIWAPNWIWIYICHYLKLQIKNTREVLRKYMLVLHWRKQSHQCSHCSYTTVHTPYTLEGTAFFWGHNCVQVFLEQRSHWSARTLSETLAKIFKMHGKFHGCLLWTYFLGKSANEQYDSCSHGRHWCSKFPGIHSLLSMKWNCRLLQSQQALHRQQLSVGNIFFLLFSKRIRNNYIGIKAYLMLYD